MRDPLQGLSLIFDLDGTLVDTAPDLVRALNETIAPDGLQAISLETVRHMVGFGAKRLIERAYEEQGRTLEDGALEAMTGRFIEVYASEIDRLSRPFEGVEDTLNVLARRGARLSVATNKPNALAVLLLERLGLAARFERIVGADAAPGKKPDPAHLRAAAGPDMSAMVMIGDSSVDVEAARNAGAPVIVMSYGYTEIEPELLGADAVLDRFDALPGAIETLISVRPSGE